MTSPDPSEPLSASALGERLNVGEEQILEREASGVLFSIVRPARMRGREYPAFQAWPGIAGVPLAQILKVLGAPATGGPAAYGFFTSKNDLLVDLTPIEVMVGRLTLQRAVDLLAQRLLASTQAIRFNAVMGAARAYRADLDA